MIDRTVVPYAFSTRQEAVATVESIAAKHVQSGYEPEHDYWWVIDGRGGRVRFIIESI